MDEKTLYKLTATEITQLVISRRVKLEEVAKSFISRSKLIEPHVHAWASFDTTYILDQVNRLKSQNIPYKSLPRLIGVPVGIKDIFNTEFYPTQKGTPVWKDYRAGNDARCVSYLRGTGGVIFGKTETAELAVHANGKTLNPYHLAHVTGSSSGGSAVAVATGMVPVALGSQTGGSIIRPASWNGVYGMKPSFGLIPRTGVLKTTDTLDTMGFFARSCDDLSLLLDILRVKGENFPIHEKKIQAYGCSSEQQWRIAFCEHPTLKAVHGYVHQNVDKFKNELSTCKNVQIVNLQLPRITYGLHALHRRIYHPCLAYYLRTEMNKAPEFISDCLKSIFKDAETIPPEDYKLALREQASLAQEMEDFFVKNKIDAIIMSSSNGSAPYKEEPEHHIDLNPLWTMCWLPVINIPQFVCAKGLPFGLQVIGPRYSDYRILKMLNHLAQSGFIPQYSSVVTPDTNIAKSLMV